MNTLEASLLYVRLGWSPIPVPRGEKNPGRTGWQTLRLREEDLASHFEANPNIGLLTGEASGGLVDVDLDSVEALRLASEFLPATSMRHGRPGKRSSHWWFVVSDEVPTFRAFKDVDEHATCLVELRTNGHQTLVPPSIHPSNESYEWEGPLEPTIVTRNTLEDAVSLMAGAVLLVRHWPVAPGSRHEIAKAVAGFLLRAGRSEQVVARFLRVAATAAGDEEAAARAANSASTARRLARGGAATGAPTLASLVGDKVVARLCDWLGTTTARPRDPGSWDRPIPFRDFRIPDFPAHALPGWLRLYVEALAEATQTPLALAGGLALGACAVGIGGRVRVRVRRGWEEPTNLYIVVALPPAERKSPVLARIIAPVLDWEREEGRRVQPAISAAEVRRDILEQRLRDSAKKAAKGRDNRSALEEEAVDIRRQIEELVVPVAPRLFTDDATPERLTGLLFEHGGRFAVISAEGGIFELLAGRYTNNSMPNLDVFLKGHAGDPLRVDRVGRAAEQIDQPALTVVLAVQNDVLRSLSTKPGFRGRGLLGRFLYAVPASRLGTRIVGAPPVPEAVEATFRRSLGALLALTPATRPDGNTYAHVLQLSPDADSVLRDFERWIEPQLHPLAALGGITDWAGKLAGATVRIAANLHLAEFFDVEDLWDVPIQPETMNAAIELGRFYLDHARAAFAEMGADPEVEGARHVLAWIERNEVREFSERDAFQGTRGRFQRVNELRPVLHLLVDHRFIRLLPSPETAGVGRPRSPQYEVNPMARGDSEDIEDSEEHTETSISDSLSPTEDTETANSSATTVTQNPHNPQNSPDDEVAL